MFKFPHLQIFKSKKVNLEIKKTKDGSTTLFVPELNEHYHSVHGALQESQHVFIGSGLLPALQQHKTLQLLEVGFGTGLNALLTLQQTLHNKAVVHYDTIEKFPLSLDIIRQLHFENFILNPELLDLYEPLHLAEWEKPQPITPNFILQKLKGALEELTLPAGHYHLVYFDAFAPEKQSELWTVAVFKQLFNAMQPGGLLVSYCAKGSFKRNLKAAGFRVEALPGPPGKREMTRAVKPFTE